MLPIIVSIPHGGTQQPAELAGRVCLSDEALFHDSDAFTREIYDVGSEVVQVVTTDIARAFVDLNRAPDDRAPANPDGVIKSTTVFGHPIYYKGMEPEHHLVTRLLGRYYHPYHKTLELAVAGPPVKLALDCHSMLPEAPPIASAPGERRPLFCLSNAGGLTCPNDLLEGVQRAFADAFDCRLTEVLLNEPFKGGYITRVHGRGPVPWVQVEMNRSLYLKAPWFQPENLEVEPERLQRLRDGFRGALNALRL